MKQVFGVVIERLSVDLPESLRPAEVVWGSSGRSRHPQPLGSSINELVLSRIRDRNLLLVREVQEALRRIETGRFGVCQECDGEIDEARLRIQPMTRVCSKCEEMNHENT